MNSAPFCIADPILLAVPEACIFLLHTDNLARMSASLLFVFLSKVLVFLGENLQNYCRRDAFNPSGPGVAGDLMVALRSHSRLQSFHRTEELGSFYFNTTITYEQKKEKKQTERHACSKDTVL